MTCAHHWQIPQGDSVTGTCRLCGETREFSNRPPRDAIDRIVVRDPPKKGQGAFTHRFTAIGKAMSGASLPPRRTRPGRT